MTSRRPSIPPPTSVPQDAPLSGAAKAQIASDMADVCQRIKELSGGLTDAQLWGPRMEIVNPMRWEVGHVGWFFERWTLRNLYEQPPLVPRADEHYDSSAVAHDIRWALPLVTMADTYRYVDMVRAQATQRLHDVRATERDAYFFRLGVLHADMHTEALTYTRQTLACLPPTLDVPRVGADVVAPEPGYAPHDVAVPGGAFMLGAPPEQDPLVVPETRFVFDNEKWAHPVTVAPFRMSSTAVTNGEFLAFVEDGGYRRRELWSDAGWAWRTQEGAEHPVYWVRMRGGAWLLRRFDGVVPLPEHHATIQVNWHEASAYCAWARRRLPTEAEWELAASAEPIALRPGAGGNGGIATRKRHYPWGDEPPTPERANLNWAAGGVIDVRALPAGDSAFGVRQMMGNVWEWTSTVFGPYPGFERDPYKDYSVPWFGDHMVLRGGCWTTRTRLIRNTWRNFYRPHRRDVLAGFRTCAL